MSDFKTVGAMFAFMLIPVWIPLIAVISGRIYDAFTTVKSIRPVAPSRTPHQIPVPQSGDPS